MDLPALHPHARRLALCALALAGGAAGVAFTARGALFAQSRAPGAETPAPASPPVRCTVRASTVDPQAETSAPDLHVAPLLAAVPEGFLLAWRTARGALLVTRLNAALERLADDRELASPAGPAAMVADAGGAAIVMTEPSHGRFAVLLARVNTQGEARNVPRELGRADAVDRVTIAWTGADHLVAWSEPSERGAGVYLVVTDVRGVPRGPARRVLDASGPRLAYLPTTGTTVLSARSNNGQGVIVSLDASGTVLESADWPANARTLVAGNSGSSAYTVSIAEDGTGATVPVVTRWTPGITPAQTQLAMRVASGASVTGLAADRGGLLAAISEPAGRELLVRVAPDASTTLLGVRAGGPGALVANAEGTLTSVGHEPPRPAIARLGWVQLSCPRPPAATTPTTTGVSASPQADAGTSADAASAGRIQ